MASGTRLGEFTRFTRFTRFRSTCFPLAPPSLRRLGAACPCDKQVRDNRVNREHPVSHVTPSQRAVYRPLALLDRGPQLDDRATEGILADRGPALGNTLAVVFVPQPVGGYHSVRV